MASSVETGDVSSAESGVVKRRVAGYILSSLVLVFIALANLPYRYVETSVEWTGYFEVNGAGNYRVLQGMPVMAGWPLRYWVRYTDRDQIQDRVWEPSYLVFNVIAGMILAVAIYAFLQWRHRRLAAAAGNRRVRLMLDAGVTLILIGIPGVIFTAEYLETRQHRIIATNLQRVGSAYLSCWLPEPLADHVPAGVQRQFVRIRKMHLLNPRPGVADVVTDLPTLVSYHDYGGKYHGDAFRNLVDNPHFCAVQLSRRELTDEDIDVISSLPWLVQFFADRTDLNANQLRKLDHLPLEHVDLSFTDVALEEIGKPTWSQTVQILRLSRPDDGISAKLVIEGWPALKELKVQRNSALLNEAVLELRLCDLPMLSKLYINRMQKHDLVFRKVPRLSAIDEGVAELRYVVTSETLFPGLTWVRSLEIEGADSLREFSCFARDLEGMSIRDARSLRKLTIGSYYTTLLGETTRQPADPERCQRWVDEIGNMSGPSEVDLTLLPLDGIDLSPLSANGRIRRLSLGGTNVEFNQVQQLTGLAQLESLDIRTTSLAENELAWVLEHFDDVRELSVDAKHLSHFDLRGKDRLREMKVSPMGRLRDLQIVDLPQLDTSIRLTRSPNSLRICNAQSLRGLAVEGPWPEDSRFYGLRDLEWFIAGGPRIDDAVLSELLNCQSLERLTLAYPSCSREMLGKIGGLGSLTFLSVPGAKVDDEIVAEWSSLKSLWEVDLSDTQISVGTIAWLSELESLRRLSINRVQLTDAAAEALAEIRQVSELHLVGVDLSIEQLRPLLRHGTLEAVDLSGWTVDDELIALLRQEGAGLRHLIVHNCEISAEQFEQLMHVGDTPYIDTGLLPADLDEHLVHLLHRRKIELLRDFRTGWRAMLQPQDDVYQPIASPTNRGEGEVGPTVVMPVSLMSQMNRQLFVPIASTK